MAHARRVLRVLAEGVEMARWSADGRAGRLAFGCLHSLTAGLMAPALTAFYATRPGVQSVAREGAQVELIEMLWDGVIEFALRPCRRPRAAAGRAGHAGAPPGLA